jgi:hypothetical protein
MKLTGGSSFAASGIGCLLVACLLVVAFPHAGFAQVSWVGTWKLNPAKSKYDPGPPPKSEIIKITPDGGWTGITDAVNDQGQPSHTEITAKFDGRDYPLKGGTPNTTRAYKRINSRAFEFTTKVNGKTITTTRVLLSRDGKRQSVTTTGKNAQGQRFSIVSVWDKQ